MSDDSTPQDNRQDKDGFADAIAALSIIAIAVVAMVLWLSSQ